MKAAPTTHSAIAAFIRANLHLQPVPLVPEVLIHTAHPRSGLHAFLDRDADAPYWAYPWAGGIALARYVLDHPEAVRGKSVLDIGAGAGVVAIAAALAGADHVTAAERDANGVAAIELNAAANRVALDIRHEDLGLNQEVFDAQVVLAGDVFYDAKVARRNAALLDRYRALGAHILVGDPGRIHLPLEGLRRLAEYRLDDFGDTREARSSIGAVFVPVADLFPLVQVDCRS